MSSLVSLVMESSFILSSDDSSLEKLTQDRFQTEIDGLSLIFLVKPCHLKLLIALKSLHMHH